METKPMKLSVMIDRDGHVISLHDPQAAGSSRIKARAPEGGQILLLDTPAELAGKSLLEIHDLVRVDLTGPAPVLKRKES
jgi:hypothetical protein